MVWLNMPDRIGLLVRLKRHGWEFIKPHQKRGYASFWLRRSDGARAANYAEAAKIQRETK